MLEHDRAKSTLAKAIWAFEDLERRTDGIMDKRDFMAEISWLDDLKAKHEKTVAAYNEAVERRDQYLHLVETSRSWNEANSLSFYQDIATDMQAINGLQQSIKDKLASTSGEDLVETAEAARKEKEDALNALLQQKETVEKYRRQNEKR